MTSGSRCHLWRRVFSIAAWSVGLLQAPSAIAQDLIHEYRFDGDGTDSAGSADGVVGSEVTFTSAGVPVGLGQAAVFNTANPYDANDAVDVDNALFTGFGTGDFSIAAWVRRTDTSGRGDIVDANGFNGDGQGFQLQIKDADALFRLRIDDENGFVRPDSTGAIDDTKWHFIVVTVDRANTQGFKYYIDGVLDSEHDPTSVPGNITPSQHLRFGSINEAGTFAGQIALFQAYTGVLSPEAVARLYCAAGDDCDQDGVADACELNEVTIGFGDQPTGAINSFSYLGYTLSPVGGVPAVIAAGNPGPSLGSAGSFSSGTVSIVANNGAMFDFVQADRQLIGLSMSFTGYVRGVQTQTQNAPFGTGTLSSLFTEPIDELRVFIVTEKPGDAWVDNIVLHRVDDCDGNGVPNACDPDCDGNGLPDGCDPDADGDGVPDACDVCPGGNDNLDADGDGVPNFCDACPGGDDRLDADGDGMPDACDACAGGLGSADTEADNDSDWADWAQMVSCLTGPFGGYAGPACDCFDSVQDGRVDLADVARVAAGFKLQDGCYINGQFYEPLARDNGGMGCQWCDPAQSITHWSIAPPGLVCRIGSGDLCDPDEVCDGAAAICPDNVVASSQTLCRQGSGDLCDPDEFCTGVPGAACPPNQVAQPGTFCRQSAGDLCDLDDVCSGIPGAPCADRVRPAGSFQCRPAQSPCDAAEFCDGVSTACPADAPAPVTKRCRDNTGTCEQDQYCDGISFFCPNDSAPRDLGSPCDDNPECAGAGVCGDDGGAIACVCPGVTLCRAAAGACDVDDYFADNGGCPDAVKDTTVVCKDNTGTCYNDVKCDGVSPDCPGVVSAKFQGSSCVNSYCPDQGVCASSATGDGCVCPDITVCRAAAGVCDQVEYYDSSGACPDDQLYGSNIVCRREWDPFNVSDAACNPPEYCDGQNVDCPDDVTLNVGDVCRASGECEAGYKCYGKCTANPDNGTGPNAAHCLSFRDCAAGEVCIKPLAFPLTCEKVGTTPADGTSCDNGNGACYNGECSSLISGQGDPCDGDDFYILGDPNGFHCDNTANPDLFCCKSGYIAKDGQNGTCKACCGNHGEDNGGCPQNSTNSMYCCSGECVDIDSDLNHCGSCDNDCEAYANNDPCISNPQCGATLNNTFTPGACFFEHPCNNVTEYCYNECQGCSFFGTCDTCTESAECIEFTLYAGASSCDACWSDSDCSGDEVCWSGCGGGSFADLTFCLNAGYCAKESSDCGN